MTTQTTSPAGEAPQDTARLFAQLCALLHRGGAWAYFWSKEQGTGRKRTDWHDTAAVLRVPRDRAGINTYFGVHPTWGIPDKSEKGEPVRPEQARARIPYVAAINCLFAELDAKDYGEDKAQALAHVQAITPAPSVVIDSGAGYHAYWLLAQPFTIAQGDEEARERARRTQAAWVAYAGGDDGAKDLARVLRVPGTLNYKYTPARPVTFVTCDLGRLYDLGELEAQAMQATHETVSARGPSTTGAPCLRRDFTGPALWDVRGADNPVTITGLAGEDDAGLWYFNTAEGRGAIPADELRPAGVPLETWAGTGRQAAPTPGEHHGQNGRGKAQGATSTGAGLGEWADVDPRRARAYVDRVTRDELARLGAATEGTRNKTLNAVAFRLGQLVAARQMSEAGARLVLMAGARDNALDHDTDGEAGVLRTIESGLQAGMAEPAKPPRDVDAGEGANTNASASTRATSTPATGASEQPGTGEASPAGAPAGEGKSKKEKPPAPTHDELAARWLEDAGRVAYSAHEWRRYDDKGGTWPALDAGVIETEVQAVIAKSKNKGEGTRPTSALLASVVKLASVAAFKPEALWDSDPDILVCENGALRIGTLALEAHAPEHYATFAVPYAYNPQAPAPVWRYFLETTLQPDVCTFLQEFAGYCLTTDTRHELAVWLYGPPGSGKSTYIEGLAAMLGERAGTLGLSDIEKSRFGLSDVPGKTLLWATESPAGLMAASDVVNRLISGERIRVERKYFDAVDITPRAKVCWAMNEWPRIVNPEDGIFRRVYPVQFGARPESERDPSIKEGIKGEGAGVLVWALEGLARLRARGRFDVPPAVRETAARFKAANDVPALFVEECCEVGDSFKEQAQALYDAYKEWCIRTGHKPQSSTTLAADWERLGFYKRRPGGVSYWHGVKLAQPGTPINPIP